MSRDQKQICLFCRWWKPKDGAFYSAPQQIKEAYNGYCYLKPPVIVVTGGENEELTATSRRPSSRADDFCEEFTAHPDDKPLPKGFDEWETVGESAAAMIERVKTFP